MERDHPTDTADVQAAAPPAGGSGAEVRLLGLARYYGEVAAVRDVNLTVAAGEFLTLLGPSGSGKTTTLSMIAGFTQPSAGDVLIGDRSVVDLPPHRRNIGVVFQSYALFPHMSVSENVAFPLRMRKVDPAATRQRVQAALDMVQLGMMGERRIHQLSGGEQQRVALARALVFRPPLLLMDEPLGALDRKLREQMQLEIKRIQRALGLTVIYVTHDQEEALILSDRITILKEGVIHQVGSPAEVYERPATPFVADFVGESNFLDGIVEAATPEATTVLLRDAGLRIQAPAIPPGAGPRVRVMIRPEALCLREGTALDAENALPGLVEEVVYLGQAIRYLVRAGNVRLTVKEPHLPADSTFPCGARVTVTWPRKGTLLLPDGQ